MLVVEFNYRGWLCSGKLVEGTTSIILNRSEPSSDEELEDLENEITKMFTSSGMYDTIQATVLNFKEGKQ